MQTMRRAARRNLFASLRRRGGLRRAGCAALSPITRSPRLPVAALPAQFSIKTGSSLRSAAGQMAEAGVLRHPGLFVLARAFDGQGGQSEGRLLRTRPAGHAARVAAQDHRRATTASVGITLVEGWTFRQMRKALDDRAGHSARDPRSHATAKWLQRLGIEQRTPEGWFFPGHLLLQHRHERSPGYCAAPTG